MVSLLPTPVPQATINHQQRILPAVQQVKGPSLFTWVIRIVLYRTVSYRIVPYCTVSYRIVPHRLGEVGCHVVSY